MTKWWLQWEAHEVNESLSLWSQKPFSLCLLSLFYINFPFFSLCSLSILHSKYCTAQLDMCDLLKKSKSRINLSHRFSFSEHLKLSWGAVYMCANTIYIYTHTHRHVIYIYIYILITSNNFVHNVRGRENTVIRISWYGWSRELLKWLFKNKFRKVLKV